MKTISRKLADYFCNNFNYENIPDKTIEGIKILLMDYLGVALRGTKTETGKIVREYFTEKGGVKESSLFDSEAILPAESAAFANAVSSHSIEMDDIDRLALFHFSPPIYSAALAVAEINDITGKELITALAAGVEMMERLSMAINPSLRNRGFHTTPVCGIFGATISSAIILRLNEEEMISALGLAGAQTSGLMEMYGESMQKRFNPGPAAHNAILAVKLAKKGFTGADTIFEGKRGVCKAYSDEVNLKKFENLKQGEYKFEIELKPYACARPIHSTIDAALELRDQIKNANLNLKDIDKVEVYRHPWWADYHTNQNPKTYHDAQMSMCFSVALALEKGSNFIDDYLNIFENKNKNKNVFDLTKKIISKCDEEFPNITGCWSKAIFKDGTEFKAEATYPKGSVENPMTKDEREDKFKKLTSFKFDEKEFKKLSNIINDLQKYELSELLNEINK